MTTKQNFLIKLDQFKTAWVMLNAAWEDLENEDFDKANVPNDKYPFPLSFDDMAIPVIEWVDFIKGQMK